MSARGHTVVPSKVGPEGIRPGDVGGYPPERDEDRRAGETRAE